MSPQKNAFLNLTHSTKPAVIASTIALLATFGAGCNADTSVTKTDDTVNTQANTNGTQMTPPTSTQPSGSNTAMTGSTGTTISTYKDGNYTAVGHYQAPPGEEQVQVTLTLKDGIVTDSTFQATSRAPRSQHYMGIFGDNYKPMVIGKKISDLHLTNVSGSSLTPMGFNDAVEKIKAQAQA